MNATVNWIKRRVSLSSPSSSPIIIHQPSPNITSPTTTANNNDYLVLNNENKISRSSSNDSNRSTPAASTNGITSRPSSMGGRSSVQSCGTRILQHDIIDPSSPLSILAATSKLTTFPYGELQALNARMNMESTKQNTAMCNTPIPQSNRIPRHPVNNHNSDTVARPKVRTMENRPPLKPAPVVKSLLASTISLTPPASQPSAPPPASVTTVNPSLLSNNPAPVPRIRLTSNQRSASATAVQAPRSSAISHKKSASLSSTQNTRSKRQKITHTIPAINLPDLPAWPQSTAGRSEPAVKSETEKSAEGGKKRVLPVRHGHSDILDGDISLLSTPPRLDNRPPLSLTHKIILVNEAIPSTPTTRYESFDPNVIPDPNTSPTQIRPRDIPSAQIAIRLLPSVAIPTNDPLPDSMYIKPHRKREFTEIRLRNREREKIDYESSLLERQLHILKSEDWRKIVAPAAAERDGLKEGEQWDWEGRRERRIALLEGVLRRVRTWREAEIKLRKGIWEQKVEEELPKIGRRKRKRAVSEVEEEEPEEADVEELAVIGKRVRQRSSQVEEATPEETAEKVPEEEGQKKKGGRRKRLMAFGVEIPKEVLKNREFKIPLEWVPEDKRV